MTTHRVFRTGRRGHSLIELMVATTLLAVGLLAVAALTALAARRAALAHVRSGTVDDVRRAIGIEAARACADSGAVPAGWTIARSPRQTRLVAVRTSWRAIAGDEPLAITAEAPCRD